MEDDASYLLTALLRRVAGGWPAPNGKLRAAIKDLALDLLHALRPDLDAASPRKLTAIAE
jgi:hypothetical protein